MNAMVFAVGLSLFSRDTHSVKISCEHQNSHCLLIISPLLPILLCHVIASRNKHFPWNRNSMTDIQCTLTILPDWEILLFCKQIKLTFLGTKYDNSVVDHPALIDVHCVVSIKCAKYLP